IVLVARAHYTADLSAFLPQSPSITQRLLVDQLRNGPAARLILVGVEGADPPLRARLSSALARRLRSDASFASIDNGESATVDRDRAFLFGERYVLSEAVTAQRFSIEGLHSAIEDTIDLLTSPVGPLVKSILPQDPTGEMLQIVDRLEGAPHPRSVEGVWGSADGQRALLIARTRAAGSDTDGQQRAIAAIRQAFAAAAHEVAGAQEGKLRLAMSGPAVFAVSARATIKHEAVLLSMLSSSVIVVLLLLVYRSVTALLLGLLPVATGALAGVAAVSVGFGVVHGITLGFGITLIGESVDYSIYLFIQSREAAADAGARSSHWVRTFWPTIRLGMLTSVFGFASLLPSAFPGLAQLGLYSVTGLVAAALVTRFVLPSLLPRHFEIRDVAPLGAAVARLLPRLASARVLLGVVPVCALIVLYMHRDGLWNRELSALSPISARDQAIDARLRADIGAPDVRDLVVVSGPDMESALRAAERAGAALDQLVDAKVISGFDSPSRFLPSLATQRERRAALPPSAVLRERLQAAVAGLPIRAERLEPFLADIERTRSAAPLTRADLEGNSLAAAVDTLLIPGGQQWNVLLPLHGPSAGARAPDIDAARVQVALAQAVPGRALVVDLKAQLDALYSSYLAEAVRLSLAGLAAIIVLLLIALRSPARVVRVVTPLVLAVLVVAALLALSGRSLTILHLVGMLLIVAVGSNYALFFDRRTTAGHGAAADLILASLLIANATTVTAFGVLAFSRVPVLQALGSTVAPGALLALVFSALLAAPVRSQAAATSG
ncbi:MAG TPA: MMPL family transporter, partial [Steroidobacteraceae bacterium]